MTAARALPIPDLLDRDLMRFHANQAVVGDCIEWTGYRMPGRAYGVLMICRNGKRTRLLAHRIAFYLHNERQPFGLVRHTCDNPACVRGEHLLDGTNADNSADMVRRGRHTGRSAGISESRAREILRRGRWGTMAKMAAEYGVSPATVCNIINRKTWLHLPTEVEG